MSEDNKKKKFNRILSQISQERQRQAQRDLSEHEFFIQKAKTQAALFDYLLFRAILEQAEGLSLTFSKPHEYQVENGEAPRLSKEAYDALEKEAILKPTKLGYMCLIG